MPPRNEHFATARNCILASFCAVSRRVGGFLYTLSLFLNNYILVGFVEKLKGDTAARYEAGVKIVQKK
jgi:hypothetical protein